MIFSRTIIGICVFIVGCLAQSVPGVSDFQPFESPEFCSQVITPTCNTTFSYIDSLNDGLRPLISELVQTPYFRYFKLNLDKQCKFWNAQHFCATENCAVDILSPSQYNWSDVTDEEWKPARLGKINREYASDDSGAAIDEAPTCEDLDYCHIDDDHNCVYVNLVDNPERFTGYGGNQSFAVWKAIYSENCFPNTNPMSMKNPDAAPESCIEKNVFYRLVSGMHASIAVHLSNEFASPSDSEFKPNLKIFMERVGAHNDRLSNVYFNYALVSEAIVKLSKFFPLVQSIKTSDDLSHQKFLSNSTYDYSSLLDSIISSLSQHTLFNTSRLFHPDTTPPSLKEEFRSRFKNVSAIMDCVGCDRCRMWGKLQTIGYGTAFKILFEDENIDKLKFRRIELVALVNTFDRLSKSISAINNFKQLYLKHLDDVRRGVAKVGDYEKELDQKNSGIGFPFIDKPAVSENDWDTFTKENQDEDNGIMYPKGHTRLDIVSQFREGYHEVKSALCFVLKSYREFPKNMFKISLIKVNYWWNVFIGNPDYVYFKEYQLQQGEKGENSYINLHT
ncbi:Piso0_002220 [Millerozyma farinosa CBS 7064]|uniref:Piso0_002220 protein n=1 Tax=Pichia sorbitophila (strain ATCC MYA-4447 / BCRC 22081 / CBS 7064 / NBRC 10061 / NRRL Y-12695) TaxID=559304 RepID=G8YEG2_PICSO|nr:Piso0_002220 [Millerozyma farinosa CBS 7064]